MVLSEKASQYTKMRHDINRHFYYGKCPFCRAEEECFIVNDDSDTFICYFCGMKGTGSDFMAQSHYSDSDHSEEDSEALQIYEDATIFYSKNLFDNLNPGYTYLENTRAMSKTEMLRFGLGYAPNEYNALFKKLSRDHSEDALLRSGLFRKTDKGYINDFFRNRVMFPIKNDRGKVIAFGGRAILDDGPKYLNSPESSLFAKRTTLFGYPYHLENRHSELIVCEGYMDCIALQNAGFNDSCAVLGTALTKEHADLIKKQYDRVILSLDSDKAGINAAKKSLHVLSEAGLSAKILQLDPAKDPDEFLQRFPKSQLQDRLIMALPPECFLARNEDISALMSILLMQIR